MSFYKKNQKDNQMSENISASEKLINDDFNIKSNLNTSLELKGIKVSEELINKTLEAIKKDMEEQPITKTANPNEATGTSKQTGAGEAVGKVKPIGAGKAAWYRNTRIIAGAAAALIIFTVGLGVITNFGKYTSKYDTDSARSMVAEDGKEESANASDASSDTSSGTDSTTNGEAVYNTDQSADQPFDLADAGTGSSESLAGSAQSKPDSDTSNAAASAKASPSAGTDNNAAVAEDKEAAKAAPKLSTTFRMQEEPVTDIPEDTQIADPDESKLRGITSSLLQEESLIFPDIINVTCENISSVKVTDLIANREVSLTSQEDIQNFYSGMEQQKLVKSTTAPTALSNYTIEITNMQGALFTIAIGDVITVSSISEGVSSQNFYYSLDTEGLQKFIEGYFK